MVGSGATLTKYRGRLGSGKTFHMVMQSLLDYYTGRVILTNMKELLVKNFYVTTQDLMAMLELLNPEKQYSLFIDEISQEADSYEFLTDSNRSFSKFIAQARKRNIDIHYTTQWHKGEIPRLRALIDYEIYCHSIRDPNDSNPYTNLVAFYYEKEDLETGRITKYIIPKHQAGLFFRYYNTQEVINRGKRNNK